MLPSGRGTISHQNGSRPRTREPGAFASMTILVGTRVALSIPDRLALHSLRRLQPNGHETRDLRGLRSDSSPGRYELHGDRPRLARPGARSRRFDGDRMALRGVLEGQAGQTRGRRVEPAGRTGFRAAIAGTAAIAMRGCSSCRAARPAPPGRSKRCAPLCVPAAASSTVLLHLSRLIIYVAHATRAARTPTRGQADNPLAPVCRATSPLPSLTANAGAGVHMGDRSHETHMERPPCAGVSIDASL